ncbi:MAG: sulfatase-like hydrolase/transferase [Saprospiraceae bacterium]|nr:sulfatase-like hydrolase/transferase [Saprospiraceae bacterium]
MRSIYWLCLCFVGLCFSCTSPSESSDLPPPNIIWLVAEDISPALGCYGDSLAKTPNIDAIASKGILYHKAYATAPICAPARSCLITGLYATAMGTQHLRSEIPFSKQLQTLPEHLAKAGYFTSNRNKTDYNFDPEGRWEHWSGSLAPWRKRTSDRPFFSFINVGPSHEGSVNNEKRYEEIAATLGKDRLTDPNQVSVPPYYPDTEDTRKVWSHYYNVLGALDDNVGQVMDSLAADGLLENTIIFFFGDHGFGMPRYKRWLYQTGLRVPLLVQVPEAYQQLSTGSPGSETDQLVSFVDFAPTVLALAGLSPPVEMQGQAFLGTDVPSARNHVFAARDRADDMYEMSRAVVSDRYIYIRHYMPHLPPIQSGFIYGDQKPAFRALRAAKGAGLNNAEQEKLWEPKPLEELYDLEADPYELNNIALHEDLQETKAELKAELHAWMRGTRDLGLLAEAEYMIRSEASTPYDYARSTEYQVEEIIAAAELVGHQDWAAITNALQNEDSGSRYWGVMAVRNSSSLDPGTLKLLEPLLNDASPSVQIMAAETLCMNDSHTKAIEVLGKWVEDDRPWLALQAARSIQLIGPAARPLIPTLYRVLDKNLGGPNAKRKYKDFNYAAFTSWALEWALQELGEEVAVN